MTKDRKSSAAARDGLVDMARAQESNSTDEYRADGLACSRVWCRAGAMGIGLGGKSARGPTREWGGRDVAAGFTEGR